MAKAIEPIFTEHKERYGSFWIHKELRGQGFGVSRRRVTQIMKKKGMKAKYRKRLKRTRPSGIQAIAAHLLHRKFCPIRPDIA